MIYMDNGATSNQKPQAVYEAVADALKSASGNPGRSGHLLSLKAGQIVSQARLACQHLLHAADVSEISFCANATQALNQAIFGLVSPGGHIITSSLEHNAVARPLTYLQKTGHDITILPADLRNGVDPDAVRDAIRTDTCLVVMTHCSNVTGTLNDIESIGAICRAFDIPFLVDAAQTAGNRPIDVSAMPIDALAFPGHKSMLGPQGTGGLYIRKDLPVKPFLLGGTGSYSELLTQPEARPDFFESGTQNVPGLAGLAASVNWLKETGLAEIHHKELSLTNRLIAGFLDIPGVQYFGPDPSCDHGAIVSVTIDGVDPQEAAMLLDSAFSIAVRAGLHCAPYAHDSIGTLHTGGTIRFSPNLFSSADEIEACIQAVSALAQM